MSRHIETLPDTCFAGLYASDPDPWRFTSPACERDTYAATLAAPPRARYRSAFEPTCSIGVFTRDLAARCDRLLAADLVPAAAEAAGTRCAEQPHVESRQGAVPADWSEDEFDLIVLSEPLSFLAPADPAALVRQVGDTIEPGGDMVLVHWLGVTDHPQSGDGAAEGFIAGAAPFAGLPHQVRTADYRIDVLRAGSAA